MKRILLTLITIVFFLTPLWADEENPMVGLIQGSYYIVGQAPEDGKAYKGTMSILLNEKEELEITRIIDGKTIICSGKMETVFEGEVTIFVISFMENNREFEAVYLIDSDLDNYARLTGLVYLKEGETTIPGLEALFPDVFEY